MDEAAAERSAMASITHVTLVSCDNFRFVIPREVAEGSAFLKDTISSGMSEAASGVVTLPEHRAVVVEKVAEYLMYKAYYSNPKHEKEDLPDFTERLPSEIALEVLVASEYLGC